MFEVLPGYNSTPMTGLAMQRPMYYFSTPYAIDWDDNGVLDLWHHNHYPFSGLASRWSDPSTSRKGPKTPIGGCMVDWDAILRDGSDGTYYAPNNGKGFIEWDDDKFDACFDVHSTAFLDIDGDGYRDLFLVTGGGRGQGKNRVYDNLLFWGEKANTPLGFRLVGGRDAAAKAGLEGRSSAGNDRGRHQYWLDVNSDSRLDVFFLNEERADKGVAPGYLYLNKGKRKFQQIAPGGSGFAEFADIALLTDLDMDGHARELIVPSLCDDRRKDPKPQNNICRRSPTGTLNVYRLGTQRLLVRESATPTYIKWDAIAVTMASADFDRDGFADTAILWRERITFHLSSKRKKRCEGIQNYPKRQKCYLSLGQPDMELSMKKCGRPGSASMRFGDFDLDGNLDLLVLCGDVGLHSLYELLPNGKWREKRSYNALGALNEPSLMLGGKDFCKGIPIMKQVKAGQCEKFFSRQACKNVRYKRQFQVCSERAKSLNRYGTNCQGATIADIDNDGYLDAIVSYRFGQMVMLRNTLGDRNPNKMFVVRLDRKGGAAASIGAIVKVVASGMGPSSNQVTTQMRVVSTLSHEADPEGGNEDRLIFGLGKKGRIRKLVVNWPHCCKRTVIVANGKNKLDSYNSMRRVYEVPAPPKNCDKSCFPK